MPTTMITIIIFAAIALSIVAIYISQARERSRAEKIRRASICNGRYQRMQQLLHDLPPQYLNNELRIMIAQRSVETLNELIQINNNPRHTEYLSADLEYLKQLKENNPSFPAVKVTTDAQAKEVRDNLEALQRFIQFQFKNKRLSEDSAKKYLNHITLSFCQSKADLFNVRAQAAKSKPRVAIHNYHCAIDAFKPIANHPQAAKTIQEYKLKIKQLEAEASQQIPNNPENMQNTEHTEHQESKNSEWDSFLEDDKDTWQKKNNYDN